MVSAILSPVACRSCRGPAGGGRASVPWEEWRADCTFFTRSVFISLADNHDNYNILIIVLTDNVQLRIAIKEGTAMPCTVQVSFSYYWFWQGKEFGVICLVNFL